MAVVAGVLAMAGSQHPGSASTPQLSGQTASLVGGQAVSVSGSGFAPNSTGSLVECSLAPGQPVVVVVPGEPPVPVSCTDPLASLVSTDGTGAFQASFKLVEGTTGPPAAAVDSAGRPSALDAAAYPCPPTPDQAQAGGRCALVFGDTAGDQAQLDLSFATGSPPAQAPPTAGSTDPSGPPAGGGIGLTSAPAPGGPCLPQAGVGSSFRSSVVVSPSYCLPEGTSRTVQVSGAGFAANGTVHISECSSALDQPVMSIGGMVVPVSCTNPMAEAVPAGADGAFEATFVVVPGTTGPPVPGTDSSGNQATLDAGRYPCPPTAQQSSSGVVCELKVDDGVGDSVVVPLTWGAPEAGLPLAAGVGVSVGGPGGGALLAGLSASLAGSASPGGSTAQPSPTGGGGTLPFTGVPGDLGRLTLMGMALVYLGLPLALGCRGPRRPARGRPTAGPSP